MNIGNVVLDFSMYEPEKDIYSDGSIEEEMLDIARGCKIQEALSSDDRWAIAYHFSPVRQNILSWYPFPSEASVLEIGSGLGAVTGVFLDRNLRVHCVESSRRRATIAAYRHAARCPFTITVGDIMRLDVHASYDYITLIGVLEYAPMFLPEVPHPFHAFLMHVRRYLKPGGTLFLAIENRLGAKYFAGAAEDHTSRRFEGITGYPHTTQAATFSRSELQTLLYAAGYGSLEWHYPYPDYKMPMQVFSDEHLPQASDLRGEIVSYDVARPMIFDERAFVQTVAGGEEFRILSNSFLVLCRKEQMPDESANH